jgi:hypothetical protein
MKVSASAPPEETPNSQEANSQVGRWALGVGRWGLFIGAAYLAAHLLSLAPSLEDIDSINFALGLRDFDPARHQPHPPGSPVYIAMGRALLAIVSSVGSTLGQTAAEALTLSLWSALAGAVALMAAAGVFRESAPGDPRGATWAVALLAACPLFWLSGLRPMSDLPGLAAALLAQALILQGRRNRRRLVLGAFVAGLAAGIRVQTVWLTMPVLALALVHQRRTADRQGPRRARMAWIVSPIAALAVGGLVWAVPLVSDSGGAVAYLRALSSQAGEDFAWVNMLWLEPTPRRLAFCLYETFVLPWGSVPLAALVAASAAAGTIVAAVRDRAGLAVLALAFGPYAAFHLLLQETITVRYALPTLPLVVWLAARGFGALGRFAPLVAVPVVLASLIVSVPVGLAYGDEEHPQFLAMAAAKERARAGPPAAMFSHYSLWRALQSDPGSLPLVEPRRQYEWLGPVEYWKGGGTAPVWFLADPRRTDLALIDQAALQDVIRFPWAVAGRPELMGSRPLGADWYRIAAPGWFAGEGWALTPETGGLAQADAAGPDHRPIDAWVRRRSAPLHLVVGGRHLGEPGDPAAEFALTLDGAVRDRWTLTVEERNFLRFLDIPEGLATGSGYGRLTIASQSAGGDARRALVGVRQFDIQPADRMLFGFGEGWHEEELDPMTGRRWRWTSERSVLRIKGAAGAVRISLKGESPLRYFDAPPTVRVTAAGKVIAQFRPDDDFDWTVTVPAGDVTLASGAIAIETDPIYLPGAAEGTADERHLGLRVYEWHVYPATP